MESRRPIFPTLTLQCLLSDLRPLRSHHPNPIETDDVAWLAGKGALLEAVLNGNYGLEVDHKRCHHCGDVATTCDIDCSLCYGGYTPVS